MSLECLNKDVLQFVSSYTFVSTRLQGRKAPLKSNQKTRKKIYFYLKMMMLLLWHLIKVEVMIENLGF